MENGVEQAEEKVEETTEKAEETANDAVTGGDETAEQQAKREEWEAALAKREQELLDRLGFFIQNLYDLDHNVFSGKKS